MSWFKSVQISQHSPLLLLDSQRRRRAVSSCCLQSNPSGGREEANEEEDKMLNRLSSSQQAARRVSRSTRRRRERQLQVRLLESISASSSSAESLEDQDEKSREAALRLPCLVQADSLATKVGSSCQQQELILTRNAQLTASSMDSPSRLLSGLCNLSTMRHLQLSLLVLLSLSLLASLADAANSQYFEVQPEPEYFVQFGHDVRLRCLVRSRLGECLWLRNGRAVGSIPKKYHFSRVPDDGDCSLLIRNVSVQQDDGMWHCQVTAADLEQEGLQSRDSRLVVLVPPEKPSIKNLVSV